MRISGLAPERTGECRFEIGEEKWIGVDYLTIAIKESQRSDSQQEDPKAL
jgi:hypothetical protein